MSERLYISETSHLQKSGYSSLYEPESKGQAGKVRCKHHVWHKFPSHHMVCILTL